MGLFRRRRAASEALPTTAFWAWWVREGHTLDPRQVSAATEELSRRVAAIHPGLSWHFGPGATSQHCLTVSAGGVAGVRPAAERWLRAAPPADPTWEFRSSQRADPDALRNVLTMGGESIELSSTVFRVAPVEEELRVHVGVYHPCFGRLPEPARAQITYLVLDWLLGEDDVERWLGDIEPLSEPPVPAASPSDVMAAVAEMAAQRDPQAWVLARWDDRQGIPGLASFRRGVRWIDCPTFDRHQIVSATYAAQENGLPADATSLQALREVESDLESLLGVRGILVAHETHRGVRTFHAYTDGEDHNVDAALDAWARDRRLSWQSEADPAWSKVRHFTG